MVVQSTGDLLHLRENRDCREPGDAGSASTATASCELRHPARIAEAAERNGRKRPGSVDVREDVRVRHVVDQLVQLSATVIASSKSAIGVGGEDRQVRAMTPELGTPGRSAKALASRARSPAKVAARDLPHRTGAPTP